MMLLPIVDRELAVAARRPGTYWLRFGAALGALAIFFVLHANSRGSMAELGQNVLNALGVATLGCCLLAGVFVTADSLALEKREGTLGLLFLTDLKGYDVVLGKLTANSVHAFFGLLAVFPVLALPVLVGGVSGAEFWRLLLVFAATLFFSLSAGMLVSAISHDARQAMASTFLWIVVQHGLLPALWWLKESGPARPLWDFLLWPSAGFAYLEAFDARYKSSAGAHDFWLSMSVLLFLAVACLVCASLILPRVWQRDSSAGQKTSRRGRRFLSFRPGIQKRPPLRDQNPYYWLAAGGPNSRTALRRLLLLFLPFWGLCYLLTFGSNGFEIPLLLCVLLSIGLHLATKVLMASESSRQMNDDRQSGALELLLVSPLPIATILAGHKRALRARFRGALWILILINLALAAAVNADFHGEMNVDERFTFLELFGGGILVLLLDFEALTWVGMWRGLKAKNHARSVLGALGQILVAPWVMIFFLLFLQPAFGPGEGTAEFIFALWFGFGVMLDLLSSGKAREQLAASLRSVAAQRYGG